LTNIIAVEVVQVDERVTRLQYYQRHEGIPNYWIGA
jgi:Uma2 family endonuclease